MGNELYRGVRRSVSTLVLQEGCQPTRRFLSSGAILSKGPLKRLAIDAGAFNLDRKSLWNRRTYTQFLVLIDHGSHIWVVPLTAENHESVKRGHRGGYAVAKRSDPAR